MYGRCVISCMLFSIPSYFPPKNDLGKFGYCLTNDSLSLNLSSTVDKGKTVRVLLTALCKEMSKSNEDNNDKRSKKRTLKTNKGSSKKIKPNPSEKLID